MRRRKLDLNKCAVCGKFRKPEELVCMQAEGDEQWLECKHCMSKSSLDRYFPELNKNKEEAGE